jgi:hypothetical protein
MKAIVAAIKGLLWNLWAIVCAPFKSLIAMQWMSIVLTIASAILAYGDTHQQLAGVPPWVAHEWPFALMVAGIIAKYGHILWPQATVLTPIQQQALEQKAIAAAQAAAMTHLASPQGQAAIANAVSQAKQ